MFEPKKDKPEVPKPVPKIWPEVMYDIQNKNIKVVFENGSQFTVPFLWIKEQFKKIAKIEEHL